MTGELAGASPYLELLNASAAFGNIPAGGFTANAQPFVFRVAPDTPDGTLLAFSLAISEAPGARDFELPVHAPDYFIGVPELDDSVYGDGDGIAEPGETMLLTFAVANTGSAASPNLSASIESLSEYFFTDTTWHALGAIGSGDETTAGGFLVEVSTSCPPVFADYLSLRISDGGDYERALPLVFCAGQAFADDFETPTFSWRHTPGDASWRDEWHREALRNHTPGGGVSWKCGGAGDLDYANLLCAILETGEFTLPALARLEFWHWMDAEVSQTYPEYCYDGALLEISTDGGETWASLAPEGGYPYLIRAGGIPGPFAAGTPVWSGQHDWALASVDLSGYAGAVKLRWIFGSDGADVREGWYIDDVRVGTGWPASADDGFIPPIRPLALRPTLLPVAPNPLVAGACGVFASGTGSRGAAPGASAAGGASLRFVLPSAQRCDLGIFDAAGRQVRALIAGSLGAGTHTFVWDGRDRGGRLVPSGTYYVRFAAGSTSDSRTISVVR